MAAKSWLVIARLAVLSMASVAIGCQPVPLAQPTPVRVNPTPPALQTPTVPVLSTPPPSQTPLPPVQELTFLVGPLDQPTAQSIYAVTVGCLDQPNPCVGQPEVLAQFDFPVFSFSWSPDGRQIALAGWTDKAQSDIYVADWNGKNLKNITSSTAKENFPAWSPDGSSIAFESCDTQGCSLMRTKVDGSGSEKLLQNLTALSELTSPRLVKWAPNGQQIVFVAGSNKAAYEQVFISNLDGTGLRQVTNENAHHMSPSLSQSGTWIAFVRTYEETLSERSDIVIEHPDGNGLTDLSGDVVGKPLDTAWAPFDNWLAFSSTDQTSAADYEVHLTRYDGTGTFNVTRIPGRSEWAPAWRIVKSP